VSKPTFFIPFETATLKDESIPIYIYEGAIDCLSAFCIGQVAISIIDATVNFNDLSEIEDLKTHPFYLVGDNDKEGQGQEAMERLNQAMLKDDYRVYQTKLAIIYKKFAGEQLTLSFKDLNEILMYRAKNKKA